MKNHLALLCVLAFGLILTGNGAAGEVQSAAPGTLTSGSYHYTLNEDGTAHLTGFEEGDTGGYALALPDQLDGHAVTGIAESAFAFCANLTRVTIPESVLGIGDYAFAGCELLADVTIPGSVISIGDYAFSGCEGLTSVTIPDSVTVIGANPFSYCSKLTEIILPAVHPALRVADGVLYSKADSRLVFCLPKRGQSEYWVEDGTDIIGESAFVSSRGLMVVAIPQSVTIIGENAFYGCEELTGMIIPSSVTAIPDGAFYGCKGLMGVTIPSSVVSIGA